MKEKSLPSREYELLVRNILQQLVKLQGPNFESVMVKHDVKIKGISRLERQVDAYWEFKFHGVSE